VEHFKEELVLQGMMPLLGVMLEVLMKWGVDIIQNCEVKGIKRNGDSVEGIENNKRIY
jgi:L-2-hydroxyglutarate oxidase LhgO